MARRNYSLRIAHAAERVGELVGPLRAVCETVGSPFFTVRPDAGDLLVNAVFDDRDSSRARRWLEETQRMLPAELQERLVMKEEPNRPHEVSAQLAEEMRSGTTTIPGAMQAREDLEAWEAFLARTRPRAVIEIGTANGTFSRWLDERVEWFRTIDVRAVDRRTPGFVQLDVWEQAEDVRALIAGAPRPLVLYCDNGNKPREAETFAPELHVGDFLAIHDLGTEFVPEDIPAGFSERLVHGLTGFYEKGA